MPCFHAGRLSATLATWLVSSAACAVGDDSDASFGSATGAGPGGDEGPSSDGESSGDDGAATTGPDAPTTTGATAGDDGSSGSGSGGGADTDRNGQRGDEGGCGRQPETAKGEPDVAEEAHDLVRWRFPTRTAWGGLTFQVAPGGRPRGPLRPKT